MWCRPEEPVATPVMISFTRIAGVMERHLGQIPGTRGATVVQMELRTATGTSGHVRRASTTATVAASASSVAFRCLLQCQIDRVDFVC